MRVCLSIATILLLCLLVSCTGEQVYGVGQGWQRNECFKIDNSQDRSRCLEEANTPYNQYERESESPSQKSP